MVTAVEPKGEFAMTLVQHMDVKGLTIRDLAEKVGATYEHVRRIVHGFAFPSKYMLKELCPIVSIELAEAEKLIVADRIRQKYGKIPAALAGKNPELEPLELAWPQLTPNQKQDIIVMVQSLARRNRTTRKD